eukprot:CAMPEP_0204299424 /NCGR_PEP_ID=MMETSP0468-20130131/76733_1 /ASSEMBLY_ACC=CAM_ASM_000383 /TAXON_ID=2969 /ORGANISM="Oxyrrhis marina" /LENGTH=105 /DNA_ID=CAMNT_0051278401 /DNA_START=10 /DNA_END=324 /DNA_ORIENTATION=+
MGPLHEHVPEVPLTARAGDLRSARPVVLRPGHDGPLVALVESRPPAPGLKLRGVGVDGFTALTAGKIPLGGLELVVFPRPRHFRPLLLQNLRLLLRQGLPGKPRR